MTDVDRRPIVFHIERIEDGWLIQAGDSLTRQRRWYATTDYALSTFIAKALKEGLPE